MLDELLLAAGAFVRLDELRLTLPLLLEFDERLVLRFTEDEREELLLLERFKVSERPALLRLGVTVRLEEVAGRETSLLLLLRLGATLLLDDDLAGREYSLLPLLLRVVGRLASRLRLSIPLVRFKLSERPLYVRLLVVLRFGVVERRVAEPFTDELRFLPFGDTAVPRRVLFPL